MTMPQRYKACAKRPPTGGRPPMAQCRTTYSQAELMTTTTLPSSACICQASSSCGFFYSCLDLQPSWKLARLSGRRCRNYETKVRPGAGKHCRRNGSSLCHSRGHRIIKTPASSQAGQLVECTTVQPGGRGLWGDVSGHVFMTPTTTTSAILQDGGLVTAGTGLAVTVEKGEAMSFHFHRNHY